MKKQWKVIAKMATYKKRYHLVPEVINSIISQVDVLFIVDNDEMLNDMLDYSRLTNQKGKIVIMPPVALTGFKVDLKDMGKLIGMGAFAKRADYIITIDDDLIYPANYVEEITRAANQFPGFVSYHGKAINADAHKGQAIYEHRTHCLKDETHSRLVDVPGTGVMAFKTSSVHWPKPEELDKTYNLYKYTGAADFFIAELAKRQSIPIKALAHRAGWIKLHPQYTEHGALFNSSEVNKKSKQLAKEHSCSQAMRQAFLQISLSRKQEAAA